MNYESQINARFPSSKEKYIYTTSDNIFSLNPFGLCTLTKLGMHFLLPRKCGVQNGVIYLPYKQGQIHLRQVCFPRRSYL
jgi:hypothetical protein